MIKKDIEYTNFNGEEKTKTCYFNLSELELSEMSIDKELVERLQKYTSSSEDTEVNSEEIYNIYKELVLKSYGEKSEDGESFIKEDENGRPLSKAFKQTAAFEAMLLEITTNLDASIEFTKGILPAKVLAEVSAEIDTKVTEINAVEPKKEVLPAN